MPTHLHGRNQHDRDQEPERTFVLTLDGQQWEVNISQQELETVHLPLLRAMAQQAAAQAGRYVVFLAGPPGSGKTSLGALWETLARQFDRNISVQTLPMDGFHYPNTILDARTIVRNGETIPLQKVKGSPESFDLDRIISALRDLHAGREFAWPRYDRQLHDVVTDAIPVNSTGIVIVEGNYLLLDEPRWRTLKPLAALRIFVECEEALVRERLLARMLRGGRTPEAAVRHYEFNDRPNYYRIMQHRLESDVVLQADKEHIWLKHPVSSGIALSLIPEDSQQS
ncbi:nucleoside/nucleotide kinase family protein [candidate division KSB3 bacterium]|uniref:Nucleoside/nucleotide kinase family protein n=1 Tax=candidate division KSB3 bacterium TaxID=2044937 RepID=A0A9D5Q6Z8_9BACT|nr:nucleoside/nucleotide kinase family protein [candidate division KSB3 bacterium]MBD3325396.1 nucleoside/nucleotide kinase family protein [candidate division KSB3 bacterium]